MKFKQKGQEDVADGEGWLISKKRIVVVLQEILIIGQFHD